MEYNIGMIWKKRLRSYELDDNGELLDYVEVHKPKNPNNKKYTFMDHIITNDKVWYKDRRDKWQSDAKKSRLKIIRKFAK